MEMSSLRMQFKDISCTLIYEDTVNKLRVFIQLVQIKAK